MDQLLTEIPVALCVQLVIVLLLRAWGTSIARRHPQSVWWPRLAWLPWVSFFGGIAGMVIGVSLLVRSFGAVANGEPSTKARLLSEGIRVAMLWSAPFVLLGWGSLLVAIIAFIIGTIRQPANTHE